MKYTKLNIGYKPGDFVYFINGGKIHRCKIITIQGTIYPDMNLTYTVKVAGSTYNEDGKLLTFKSDCIYSDCDSLMSAINNDKTSNVTEDHYYYVGVDERFMPEKTVYTIDENSNCPENLIIETKIKSVSLRCKKNVANPSLISNEFVYELDNDSFVYSNNIFATHEDVENFLKSNIIEDGKYMSF